MAYAEWKSGRHLEQCVFEAFFRKSPFKGPYTIFAGLDEVLRFLKTYKFTENMIAYLKQEMPHLQDVFLDYLRNLDCSNLKVRGFLPGTIAFPNEPLLSLEGPFTIL